MRGLGARTEAKPIDYPKPDGVLTFDRFSSVFLSNTNHEEDQPVDLTLKDPDYTDRYHPAGVCRPSSVIAPQAFMNSSMIETGEPRLQINAQNCVHCKTCDIKDPTQNINWVTSRRRRRSQLSEHVACSPP